MARILVTGAAGFIGSHLTDRLLARGDEVLGFDSFVDTYDPAAKRRNLAAALGHGRFTLHEGDIRDADAVGRAFAACRPQKVVHLAALAGVRPSIQQPSLYADVNVTGTCRLLDAAVEQGVDAFIFGSSSSVYGNNAKVPFAESDPVDRPISPYAATKRAGELAAHSYHHVHALPVTCLRFFTVFGPRQRPDLAIHKFMRLLAEGKPIPLFGDGSTSRDYTFIDDILDGVTAAMDRCEGFDILNLGSHHPVTLGELVRAIEQTTGLTARIDRMPMQPGDVERTYADVTRAGERLGYKPKHPLMEGLARQWEWIQGELL